jgi:predicted metal-dependent hydrolase
MKKTIILDGQTISYVVRLSHRARHLRMTIETDGSLIVTIPNRLHEPFVGSFLRQKSSWILKHIHKMKKTEGKTVIKYSRHDYERYKYTVYKLVKERLEFFNAFYKFEYRRISIRNQSSLWGSCTREGNLQFNYKLMYMPKRTIDYIVVHELCHLKEHNHSDRFWALVSKMIPDYKAIRKSLRQYVMQEG